VFGLEVLRVRDEDQRLLERRIVLLHSRSFERLDQELGVRQIGTLMAAVTGAAIGGVRAFQPLSLVPLQFAQEIQGVGDLLLISTVGVRCLKSQQ
jgi:hypothetical protein